jgi:DNA repair protein RecN (Recombination protein N)
VITQLRIEGLAIIDALVIDFSPGLNIITGETGAGKSILIRALHFLFGAKFGTDVIRKGCESAVVSATFELPPHHVAIAPLEALGLIVPPASEARVGVIVRRLLSQKGRSQGWINDIPVTTGTLKEVGTHLIDIFAQHENQRLLDPSKHVHYLDLFLKQSDVLEKVQAAHQLAEKTVQRIRSLCDSLRRQDRDSDYLNFRLEELKSFEPSAEEYIQTRQYCLIAEKGQALREWLSQARFCLEGESESGAGAVALLQELVRSLGKVRLDGDFSSLTEAIDGFRSRAESLATEASDLAYEFEKLFEKVEVDETLLEEKQQRLFNYQGLFRKHGVATVEALVNEQATIEQHLGSQARFRDDLIDAVGTLLKQAVALSEAAIALSTARMAAAETVQHTVQSELRELVMAGAVFETEFGSVHRAVPETGLAELVPELEPQFRKASEILMQISANGAEKVQFLMATNPGEPVLPLAGIASGGEVSRVMLALKKALVADAETCVLVFDEIDTGISGRVADVVGRKMRELSESVQVVCISHLPQVAVYADAHFLVDKTASGRTSTTIVQLSGEQSAKEIARLLSGAELSADSLANAKNLIARARKPAANSAVEKPKTKKSKKPLAKRPSP